MIFLEELALFPSCKSDPNIELPLPDLANPSIYVDVFQKWREHHFHHNLFYKPKQL